jgi:hypothetical protein
LHPKLFRTVPGAVLLAVAVGLIFRDAAELWFFSDDFVLLERSRDQSFATILAQHFGQRFEAGEGSPGSYWRPGWLLLFKAVHSLFGLQTAAYTGLSLLFHLGIAIAIANTARRLTGVPGLGLAAGLLFLSSPAYLEGVLWTAAAFNVLPAAGLLLLATLAYLRYLRADEGYSSAREPATARRRAYGLAFGLVALSLTFREAAYHFPLVVLAAHLTLDRTGTRAKRWRRALVGLCPFLVLLAAHYVWLNRVAAGEYGAARYAQALVDNVPVYFLALVGLADNAFATPTGLVWLLIGTLFPALWWFASGLGRFLLLWSIAALFPYALQTTDERFAYFWHVPLALFLPVFLRDLPSLRGIAPGLLAAGLIALATVGALRTTSAVEHYRTMGRTCHDVLRWARGAGLEDGDVILVDHVPPALMNGFGPMLDLYLGVEVAVHNLILWPKEPFVILGNPIDVASQDHVHFLHWEPARQGYRVEDRLSLPPGLVPVPSISFCERYEVADSAAAALARFTSGALDAREVAVLLQDPLVDTSSASAARLEAFEMIVPWRRFALEVRTPARVLLLICLPIDLLETGGTATIDGENAPLMAANGCFNALVVPAGAHRILLDVGR